MFEIKHLKTLTTLLNTGNIREAADELYISQSALSHQIKDLEQRLNTPLFIRNSSPIQFTEQGKILLQLADEILPKINQAIDKLRGEVTPKPQLNIAIACHACFQWLLPVTKLFLQQNPKVNITFSEGVFSNDALDKDKSEINLLFTDEKTANDGFTYHTIGQFEVVSVFAKHHDLTEKSFISAEDIKSFILLTYPLKTEQLDIFKLFLNKEANNKHRPKSIKQVANSHMILQMVAADMGIATLPDWLVGSLSKQSLVQTKRIGKKGIYKTLYARYKTEQALTNIIQQLIPKTVAAFDNLYHTQVIEKG